MAVKKASFNLPEEEIAELKQLAAARKVTVTQVLRQAIADTKFLQEQEGKKLVVEDEDGSQVRVVIHR